MWPTAAGSVCCGCDKQIHMDYRSPVEKRDGTATLSHSLSERDGRDPCLDRLLLLFWAHYFEDGPHLIICTGAQVHFRWLPFTENKGEEVANQHQKGWIFTNVKGKMVELVTLVLGRFSIDFRKLL